MLTLPSVAILFTVLPWCVDVTHEDCFQGQKSSLCVRARSCDGVTDAKCLEVRQIYRGEWTVSEDLEQTHKHCSALSPTHTSGHKPVNVPVGKDLWWAELLPSSQPPPAPSHTPCFRFLPGLVCSSGVLCIPLCYGPSGRACVFVPCMSGVAKFRRNPLEMKCFSAVSADLPVKNVLQLTHFWLSERGYRSGRCVWKMWKKWDWKCVYNLGFLFPHT